MKHADDWDEEMLDTRTKDRETKYTSRIYEQANVVMHISGCGDSSLST